MENSLTAISNNIMRVYRSLDISIRRIQMETGLHCPEGCGACCLHQNVEATVAEVIPLCHYFFRTGYVPRIYEILEIYKANANLTCILYLPDPDNTQHGRCQFYNFRPLICRMFGFGSRKNRLGQMDVMTCRMLKQQEDAYQRYAAFIKQHVELPVVSNYFYKIAMMVPEYGLKLMPVNDAIQDCIEFMYWKMRRRMRPRLAS
ncbi:YkgJ family cysteine cluster protein [bacterium]|nr:YkgJ family cysteine cluster protein [candidate division CSSED10-310 bacterium]